MSTIKVQTQTLQQAANAWGHSLQSSAPFSTALAEQPGVSNISVGPDDAASHALVSATADWPSIYVARYNQRETLAEQFVAGCGGAAQIFTQSDQTGANQISTAAPSAAGPALV